MRMVRLLGFAVFSAAVPALLSAQSSGPRTDFENSWYWGVRGGVTSFNTGGLSRVSAPTIGGEWLITRKHGALSLSVDQSMFEESTGIYDPSLAGSVRPVDIKDMRRYTATLLAFPIAFDQIRPYVGAGIALNVIQNASPIGNFVSTASQEDVLTRVNDQSSRAAAIFTGGLMFNLGRAAIYGQASAMSTRERFLINGSNYTFAFEGGVRYNLVNALENIW